MLLCRIQINSNLQWETSVSKITHARITAMPQGFGDPMPKVVVRVDEGEEVVLFDFFPDEISFQPNEFIGLTRDAAFELKRRKDVEYLRS